MKKWVTAVPVVAALVGVGLLVYWQWDPIWAFVFSPIGGFVTKVLLGGKVLKVLAGIGFAVAAGWVAARRKLRRGTPEPEPEYAPPVYGPPEAPPEAPPPAEPQAPPAKELTSTGTATATTTEQAKAPTPRPI